MLQARKCNSVLPEKSKGENEKKNTSELTEINGGGYSSKDNSAGRIKWVDIAKGIGILLVMISHGSGIPVIGLYLNACYIPLFFILSGYCFKNTENFSLKKYIQKRIKTLLIPYLAYSLICVFCYLLFLYEPGLELKELAKCIAGVFYSRLVVFFNGDIDIKNIYLLRAANSPLWFLTALFTASVLFGVYIKNSQKKVVATVYMLLSILFSYSPILLPWSIDMAPLAALFMIIAYELRRNVKLNACLYNKSLSLIKAIETMSAVAAYIVLVYTSDTINMSVRMYGHDGILGVITFLIIGCLGTYIYVKLSMMLESNAVGDFLSKIGRISLTLMCTHYLVFKLVGKTLSYFSIGISSYLVCLIQILFSVLVAVLTEKMIIIYKKLRGV